MRSTSGPRLLATSHRVDETAESRDFVSKIFGLTGEPPLGAVEQLSCAISVNVGHASDLLKVKTLDRSPDLLGDPAQAGLKAVAVWVLSAHRSIIACPLCPS